MYSDAKKLVPTARHRLEFLNPEKQLDQTARYNEMVYKRYQNGERKQPDYIVVFRKREEVSNMEKAVLAAKQWKEFGKEIPIVVVDIDKCREEGLKDLGEMVGQCQSQQELTAIKNKMHRLSVWNEIPNRYNEKIESLEQKIGTQEQSQENEEKTTDTKEPEIQESKEEPIGIETFKASLDKVNANDRNVEMQRISNLAKQIVQEAENYRGTQDSQDIGDDDDGR